MLQKQWYSILRQNISYSVIWSRALASFHTSVQPMNVHSPTFSLTVFTLGQKSMSCINRSLINDCIMPMNLVDIVFVNMNCWEWLVANYNLVESTLVSLLQLQLCTVKPDSYLLKRPELKKKKAKIHSTYYIFTCYVHRHKCT